MDGTVSEDYVAIVEIRDELGVTSEIMLKSGKLAVGDTATIRFSWTPLQAGGFYAKAFVISSLESPEILSEISQSSIKVVSSMAELDQLFPTPQVEAPIADTPRNASAYTFLVYMLASDLESTG
ncbi:MAG: hypothetical protein ACRD99_01775, partial [Nitrososphaera sp.]